MYTYLSLLSSAVLLGEVVVGSCEGRKPSELAVLESEEIWEVSWVDADDPGKIGTLLNNAGEKSLGKRKRHSDIERMLWFRRVIILDILVCVRYPVSSCAMQRGVILLLPSAVLVSTCFFKRFCPIKKKPFVNNCSPANMLFENESVTFIFTHLADAFIQSDLVHSGYKFFISMCVLWESNPRSFALLTRCSTTEPQELVRISLQKTSMLQPSWY